MKWLLAFLLFFPVAGYAQTGFSPTTGITGGTSMPDLSERAYLPPSQWAENRAFYGQQFTKQDCNSPCGGGYNNFYSSDYYYGYGRGGGYGYGNGYGYANPGYYPYNQGYNYNQGCSAPNYTNPYAPGFRTPSIFR